MDFAGSKYYELTRTLLLSIGLWPYEESTFKRIKMLVSSGFVASGPFSMIAKIITSRYDTAIVLRTLAFLFPFLIPIGKYITFLLIPTSLKELMERIQNDWNTLKDAKELEIIRKYTHLYWFCTVIFLVFGYTCAFVLLMLICIPSILDIMLPLNVTRERRFPIDTEYFIDQNEYYYTISCHILISTVFGITTTLGTESLYIAYIQHGCGMLKITWFHDFLWSKLAVSYFLLLIIGVVSLSINLFRAFQIIIVMDDINELLLSSIFILVHFFYLFLGNLVGQFFIDHSINVYKNLCDTRWYHVPLREQKLILIILHRSMHSCKLVTGGTFVLSLEGFTTVMATSISYFTVLLSVQN